MIRLKNSTVGSIERRLLWNKLGNHGRTVDPMASVTRHKNCKLRALSNECCLDFIGQSIDEISHFSPLRHCLRPSKWHDSRPIAKFRYPSEPLFDAESKLCTHLIVAQPTRELQPDFTSILPFPKLEKLTAPRLVALSDYVDTCVCATGFLAQFKHRNWKRLPQD